MLTLPTTTSPAPSTARVLHARGERPLRRTLCPACPEAVLIPPILVYLVGIAATAGLHAALIPNPSALTFLRVATIVALHIPALFAVRSIAIGLGSRDLSRAIVPVYSVVSVVVMDAAIPGNLLNPLGWALIAAISALAYPVTRVWQRWWVRRRPACVTLLASKEWGADEAIHRLEVIPGLIVKSVMIPDCDADAAERLLCRPASDGPADSLHLEKRVIVSCPMRDPAVGSSIARLVALGHHISSESAMLRAAEGRIDTDVANPLSLLLERPRHWFSNALSRAMDILLSAALIVLFAPVMALVAAVIVLETGFPIIYRQRRVGLRGRLFDMFKFRSMYQGAESRSGPVWAAADDPRVTKVGRILRRTRLDELPQLFNVLVGQMALVGPRPERPHFFNLLRREVPLFEMRTIVRPGVTGWAQVRSPYAAAAADARNKLEYDLYYVIRRSPWFDLAILFETVGVAFSGRGAR